jgi:hypothetical protein
METLNIAPSTPLVPSAPPAPLLIFQQSRPVGGRHRSGHLDTHPSSCGDIYYPRWPPDTPMLPLIMLPDVVHRVYRMSARSPRYLMYEERKKGGSLAGFRRVGAAQARSWPPHFWPKNYIIPLSPRPNLLLYTYLVVRPGAHEDRASESLPPLHSGAKGSAAAASAVATAEFLLASILFHRSLGLAAVGWGRKCKY